MFHPSELEGEVDHTFFDSDDGVGSSISRDEVKKQSKSKRDERRDSSEKQSNAWSTTNKVTKEGNQCREGEKSKVQRESKERGNRASSVSSESGTSEAGIDEVNGQEDSLNHPTKRPSGTLMALLVQSKDAVDDDGYHHSHNETEEEEEAGSASRHGSVKGRIGTSPRRVRRSRRHRSSSSATADSNDTDCDGSSCSDGDSSRMEDSDLSKRKGSGGSVRSRNLSTDQQEDTVTDVTPLSSPDRSLLQALELNDGEDGQDGRLGEGEQESAPSSDRSKTPGDSYRDGDEFSFSSESRLGDRLVLCCPGGRNRKNFSFSNSEVRRIDRENQRLLRAMSRLSSRPSSGSTVGPKSRTQNKSPVVRLPHSAINRQREQQRIERENLALLKRLESVKPTKGLTRSDQLAEYHQQRYWGTPTHPIYKSINKKERTSIKTPSNREPRLSSAAMSETTSVRELGPRPKKPGAARPAWN